MRMNEYHSVSKMNIFAYIAFGVRIDEWATISQKCFAWNAKFWFELWPHPRLSGHQWVTAKPWEYALKESHPAKKTRYGHPEI